MNFDQGTTWILTSDSNTCRIYKSEKHHYLKLVKEMCHPESKFKDTELTSGKSGHFTTKNSAQGVYTQQTDPKEIEADDFAREIAEELDNGRNRHAYDRLIVVAPPHMNGLLFQHVNKHVNDLVTHNIKNDAIHFTEQELSDFLHKHVISI